MQCAFLKLFGTPTPIHTAPSPINKNAFLVLQEATAVGAVFQFFVRDIMGMAGGVLFTFCSGSSFDSCAKQWRLFADIMNNVGMTLELASPLFPTYFLLLACLGKVAQSVTGRLQPTD